MAPVQPDIRLPDPQFSKHSVKAFRLFDSLLVLKQRVTNAFQFRRQPFGMPPSIQLKLGLADLPPLEA